MARERLELALGVLERLDTAGPSEVRSGVHKVRKRCKEVRAVARLVREPLGAEWSRFNGTVRDAASELSPIRDAHAALATFDDLLDAHHRQEDPDLRAIRSTLAQAAASVGEEGRDDRVERATGLLMAARDGVGRWKIDAASPWLKTGFSSTYDRGRRGLRRARKKPTDDRIHEWRKAVKTFWYQVRLIELAAPSLLTPLIGQLDRLGAALGDDHDLSVLVAQLDAEPWRFGGDAPVQAAVLLARSQQDDLRIRALRLGATLYAETTEAFATRIESYWLTAARSGPELNTGAIADIGTDSVLPRTRTSR